MSISYTTSELVDWLDQRASSLMSEVASDEVQGCFYSFSDVFEEGREFDGGYWRGDGQCCEDLQDGNQTKSQR